MSDSYNQAKLKYKLLLEIVYESVEHEFPGIGVKDIDFKTCEIADKWKDLPNDDNTREYRSGWNWTKAYTAYRTESRKFEISLWAGAELCALSYGRITTSKQKLRLDLVEATPVRPSPLGYRCLQVISFAAIAFGRMVNAEEIWLIDPYKKLENYYKSYGFSGRVKYGKNNMGQRRLI